MTEQLETTEVAHNYWMYLEINITDNWFLLIGSQMQNDQPIKSGAVHECHSVYTFEAYLPFTFQVGTFHDPEPKSQYLSTPWILII